MSTLRLPLRLARREVWRRPGRTALVALLVALPVAGMVMAVVLFRTDRVSSLERWERDNGQADAQLYDQDQPDYAGGATSSPTTVAGRPGTGEVHGGGSGDAPDPASVLPAGARVVEVTTRYERVRSDAGRTAGLELKDFPLDDPMTRGIMTLRSGRAPVAGNEVALTDEASRRLHATIGDTVELRGQRRHLEVVGLVERAGCLSCLAGLVAPGELDGLPAGTLTWTLVDLPDAIGATDRAALADELDGRLLLREVAAEPGRYADNNGPDPIRWSLVLGALVLTVAGIVISAAFAVGARRQLVTIGQLAASGVSPNTIRSALVLQGTVTGVIGSATGLVIAAATLLLGSGVVERMLDQRVDTYTVHLLDVALAVVIGIGAATLAALIPARSTARIPTLTALAGRRPVAPVPARLISWGVVSMVGGLGLLALAVIGSQSGASGEMWAYVAILGGVAELLGACALAPFIVARLEPLAGRLRGPWRLGARSLARHRARTGAVVSAVAAAGALAIASGALLQGAQARELHGPDLPDDVVLSSLRTYDDATGIEIVSLPITDQLTAISRALGGVTPVTVRMAGAPTAEGPDPSAVRFWEVRQLDPSRDYIQGASGAFVADAAVLDLLRAPAALRAALVDPGVVVLTGRGEGRAVEVSPPDGSSLAARLVSSRYSLGYDSTILISPTRAAELGLPVTSVAAAFQTDHALTAAERETVGDVTFDLTEGDPGAPQTAGFLQVQWYSPPGGPSLFAVELMLTGLALVFTLFVVGVSLALAAAESRDERDVLSIAGAPPATVARSAGARAWLLAAIGGAMAIPVGFLPVMVFTKAGNGREWPGDLPLVFPGRTALTLLLLVPLCAALVAWAASATAQRFRPVRVSTATFE